MFGIGGWEMLLILVVALVVFGPKRLPELARSLGRGLAEFRRASTDLRKSFDLDLDSNRTPPPEPETLPPAQAGSPALTAAPNATSAASGPTAGPDAGESADRGEPGTRTPAAAEASEPAAAAADEPSDRSGD
jgi:sec-independent protein translocase protein TatB